MTLLSLAPTPAAPADLELTPERDVDATAFGEVLDPNVPLFSPATRARLRSELSQLPALASLMGGRGSVA